MGSSSTRNFYSSIVTLTLFHYLVLIKWAIVSSLKSAERGQNTIKTMVLMINKFSVKYFPLFNYFTSLFVCKYFNEKHSRAKVLPHQCSEPYKSKTTIQEENIKVKKLKHFRCQPWPLMEFQCTKGNSIILKCED